MAIIRVWDGRSALLWWWHHHRVGDGMLQLWALLVVMCVSVRRHRRRGHRRSRACTIRWWWWIRSWRRHPVGARGRHVSHSRRIHTIRRMHTRGIWHMLHIGSWHEARRRRRHAGHHRLAMVIPRISIDISSTRRGGSSLVFLVRRRWHWCRSRRRHMRSMRSRRVLGRRVHHHVSLAAIRPHCRYLRSISDFVVLERIEVILDVDRGTLLDGTRAKEGIGCDGL